MHQQPQLVKLNTIIKQDSQKQHPVTSQVEHFSWSFIFCSFSYSLSHIQWNSCQFLAAGGIKSHSCIYKPALFFHFLVCSLNMEQQLDRVKEHFIFAKNQLNNYIQDDSEEVRCFEFEKCISTWSPPFRVRHTHTWNTIIRSAFII